MELCIDLLTLRAEQIRIFERLSQRLIIGSLFNEINAARGSAARDAPPEPP